MRIVSWNCNRVLNRKIDRLLELRPDIAVVQECEARLQPPKGFHFLWHGVDPNKGVGILAREEIRPMLGFDPNSYAFFVPVMVPALNVRLLAVWAFNHRAAKFSPPRSGLALEAISSLREWLSSGRSLVLGDFNNNQLWDRPNNPNRFGDISDHLGHIGLFSAYHQLEKEAFGAESSMTHYFQKNEARGFHIDYCFVHKSLDIRSVHLLPFNQWREESDHIPLVVEIE